MTLEEFKKIAEEKLSHSFYGTLSFFLILANWKYLVTAFTGDIQPDQRIEEIQAIYAASDSFNSLGFPLIMTVLAVAIKPVITSIIEYWSFKVKLTEENIKAEEFDKSEKNNKVVSKQIEDALLRIQNTLKHYSDNYKDHLKQTTPQLAGQKSIDFSNQVSTLIPVIEHTRLLMTSRSNTFRTELKSMLTGLPY